MSVIGVEITASELRAVVLGGWRSRPVRTFETAWDPALPMDAVTRLRAELGSVERIGLAVGLAYLHVGKVTLPQAPLADRRKMLGLEPDRFFPVQGEAVAVALDDASDFAFAIDAKRIGSWVDAFESWATVDAVEPAPICLARALAGGPDGLYAVPAGPDEHGWVELRGGRLHSARRTARSVEAREATGVPAHAGVPGLWLSALGAARGLDAPPAGMLLPDALVERVRRRRLGRLLRVAVACTLSLGATLWALDGSREGTLRRIREESQSLETTSGPAAALLGELAVLDRERMALAELGRGKSDPLFVLAALTERLPREAVVLSFRGQGEEWQIEGTAADAAAIVPLLDADPRFRDVRFLSASARFREGERTYETFSIAFNVVPDA